ncbi:MAG: ArsA family ATPase [Deltaproteobacteria bacterium]|nr:ArsA family ATPase [Deltaproteobacteria bacterium]
MLKILSMSEGLQALLNRKLLIVAGKGGTGRSSMSACLALVGASRGKKVLLLDARSGSYEASRILSGRKLGSHPEHIGKNMWAAAMMPRDALREYVTLKFKFDFIFRHGFDSAFARSFLNAIPGLDDLLLLGKVLNHVREREPGSRRRRFDLVILDGPATGHGITFIKLPEIILDAVFKGPLKKEAAWMQAILQDPVATSIILVSLAEELPARETVQLYEAIRTQTRVKPLALFFNRVLSRPLPRSLEPLFHTAERCASRGSRSLRHAIEAWRWTLDARRRQRREINRLKSMVNLVTFELPELGHPVQGQDDLIILTRHLQSGRGA